MQGISRALFEQVNFDKKGVTSTDWVTYPILRFKDSPKVTLDAAVSGRTCRSTTRRRSPPAAPARRAPASRPSCRCRPRSPTRSSTPRASASARRR